MKTGIFARVANLPGLRPVVRRLSDRRGVTALEYGLVAALAAVAIIAAMGNFGSGLGTVFNKINSKLTTVSGSIS